MEALKFGMISTSMRKGPFICVSELLGSQDRRLLTRTFGPSVNTGLRAPQGDKVRRTRPSQVVLAETPYC